ncbi:MAG: site-2 protease family protein [Nitrospinae bacterium]|nr:site-2 protease family protein [Nitrospinota bacterium]
MQELREFSTVQTITVMALPLVFAIVLHEVAHGYVAWRKGDDTARVMGRLSLNPLVHIDLFGTIILPLVFFYSTGMLFAFAKPVPVNFMALRRPKEDMVWVAAAGPGTNVVLALLSALGIKLMTAAFPETSPYIAFMNVSKIPLDASPVLFPLVGMLYYSVILNVILAIINLIPIPPADGGRIMVGLLPRNAAIAYSRIEPFGMILLIILIMFDPFGVTHRVLSPLISTLVGLLL